jgi:hypothetical protein
MRPIRAKTGRRVKVISSNKEIGTFVTLKVETQQAVHGLAPSNGVIFSNADKTASLSVDDSVRISHIHLRSNRARLSVWVPSIDPLIAEV